MENNSIGAGIVWVVVSAHPVVVVAGDRVYCAAGTLLLRLGGSGRDSESRDGSDESGGELHLYFW